MALTLEFDDAEAAVLLDRLGLPEDTTDEQLVRDTLKDALRGVPLMADAPPSAVAAAAAKVGLEVLDSDSLKSLRTAAAEAATLKAAAKQQRIEAAVDAAVSRGAISMARKAHWVEMCSHDEQMLATLAAFPNELAVPMAEQGHSVEPVDRDQAPAWFY